MNNFIFENATKVYFGRGCVEEYLGCLLKSYGENVMLAYGGGSVKRNGIYDQVVKILSAGGKRILDFPGIMPNPTYRKVMEGARAARENGVSLILGLGGGSVVDCCKAISLAARYEGDVWNDFWIRPGRMDFNPLPLGVIATAAGSGSEMNGTAMITHEAFKIKTGRDYPQCNARFALLDPCYTLSVPVRQMIAGGFDALSRIMEIYFSTPDENNVSDTVCEALMKSVICNLRAAIREPKDYTARSNLMWAAAVAESRMIRLGKRADFQCRQIGHQLDAYANCSHGEGMAVLQPAYYRHTYKEGKPKFARFTREVWGVACRCKTEETLVRAGVEALAGFVREIGLPGSLRELGLGADTDLKAIADSCGLAQGGYRAMTHREILDLLRECY